MAKKTLIIMAIILCIFSIFSLKTVNAQEARVIDKETESQLIEIKETEKKELEDFKQAYGNDAYGFTAYILSKIRIYSIPLCFIGIAVGAIYQYVIGIRKLDVRDRGMMLVVSFVTLLVICQVLPLVFAIVVKGWRN